jgi:DNA-binding LytR/AlgR family response regulator
MIKALIAEDEPLLRAQLREGLLALWPELHVAGEAGDGIAALSMIESEKPDVLFLDIRMPGMSGLDIAKHVSGKCHVVFITAFNEYAIAAFEQGVVDYVLKPVELARLATTLARVKSRIGETPANISGIVENIGAPDQGHLKWIQASVGTKLRFITTSEVVYFQADAKYTRVITAQHDAFIRKPIKELVNQLDPELFWQIHRGTIVNVSYIAEVNRDILGRVEVSLQDRREQLLVSKAYQFRFRQM